jgi:hypothetical protein
MNKFLLTLTMALFLVGCATTGGNSGALPEIAPYDEPTYEPLWEPLPEIAPYDEPTYEPLPS